MKLEKEDLLRLVDEHSPELIRLCQDLIRIPSENPGGSQREVMDYVKAYLDAANIKSTEVGELKEFPSIYAEMGEKEGYTLIFNGHLDVVPAGDLSKWRFDPFGGEVVEGKILGRGASDMKCGVAAVLFVAKLLAREQIKLKGQIRLHLVSDEETGGVGTSWLCENGYADGADACIVAEPTSKTIEIGQKGKLKLTIHAKGQPAHGSLGGFKGENAIMKLIPALDRLANLTKLQGSSAKSQLHALDSSKQVANKELGAGAGEVIDHVAVNVGVIKGGTAVNMVPENCEAIVDIRVPLGLDRQTVDAAIKECLEKEDVTYKLEWHSDANATDEYDPLVQSVKTNAESLWPFEVIPAYQWASSDAREYRELGLTTLQYGPSNTEGIHSYNEDVDVLDVVNTAKIYLLTIFDLLL